MHTVKEEMEKTREREKLAWSVYKPVLRKTDFVCFPFSSFIILRALYILIFKDFSIFNFQIVNIMIICKIICYRFKIE